MKDANGKEISYDKFLLRFKKIMYVKWYWEHESALLRLLELYRSEIVELFECIDDITTFIKSFRQMDVVEDGSHGVMDMVIRDLLNGSKVTSMVLKYDE